LKQTTPRHNLRDIMLVLFWIPVFTGMTVSMEIQG